MIRSKKPSVPAAQPYVIRRSRIQGRGAFATRDIKKGERICEYAGERISISEADRRYDVAGRHHTYVFTLSTGRCIDGAVGGNDSRYFNHSCEPNCEAIEDRGHIYIDATRSIKAGEELLYDYSYDPVDEPDSVYACICGAPSCRTTIIKRPPKRRRRKSTTKRA